MEGNFWRWRLGVAAAAAVVGLGLVGVAYASSTGGWVVTATQGLRLVDATSIGPAPAGTPLQVTVALQLRNRPRLDGFIRSVNTPGSADYGQWLNPAGFEAAYGPTATEARAVAVYLSSHGFRGVTVAPNRLMVDATGTVGEAESAFHTSISSYLQRGRTVYANTTAAEVPAALGSTVGSVLGLNDVARDRPTTNPPSSCSVSGVGYPCTYNPQGFWEAYDVGATPTGSRTTIAIFAEGNLTQVVKDLRTEEAANGLPKVPVTIVPVGVASPDTSAADEWDLDTQYSTGMAGTVKRLYVYDTTTLTDSDTAREFNAFAAQDVARAGSASFGECENEAFLDGAMLADDEIFAEAAAQGQTAFASAGDSGGFCAVAPTNGVPAGEPDVNYPAASPYVVGVGGTTLVTNSDGSYKDEAAWVAGGGGISYFEAQPYWQGGVAPPTSTICSNVAVTPGCGRTVPDIAMDADPNSGANVYVSGTPEGVGGTSLASPLSLGVWARLESAHGNGLGFASPALYKQYGGPGFHDVVLGDTGPYPATPGYDLATGMGSFDVAQMDRLIAKVPTTSNGGPAPDLAPACKVVSDPYGDSHPLGSTGNVDSLDIRDAGFDTSGAAAGQSGATSITASLGVQSLSDGPGGTPMLAGDGDVWYVTWTYNGTSYFLSAEYPGDGVETTTTPPLPVDFSYGTVTKSPTGGSLYNSEGSATGSLDLKHGIITVTAPASELGNPPAGASLTATGAATFESVGTPAGGLLEQADSAGPGSAYAVGKVC